MPGLGPLFCQTDSNKTQKCNWEFRCLRQGGRCSAKGQTVVRVGCSAGESLTRNSKNLDCCSYHCSAFSLYTGPATTPLPSPYTPAVALNRDPGLKPYTLTPSYSNGKTCLHYPDQMSWLGYRMAHKGKMKNTLIKARKCQWSQPAP